MTYTYRAQLDRVVDGDTVDLLVDLGFYVQVRLRFRLVGVDTPERGEDGFAEATSLLRERLTDLCMSDGHVWVQSLKTGKYGRWLGQITSADGRDNINAEMAERWPGREYDAEGD